MVDPTTCRILSSSEVHRSSYFSLTNVSPCGQFAQHRSTKGRLPCRTQRIPMVQGELPRTDRGRHRRYAVHPRHLAADRLPGDRPHLGPAAQGKHARSRQILALCVGDTLDADKRSAFPKTKADLLAEPRGDEMFRHRARGAGGDGAHIPGFPVSNPNKFCHGFGIFQYDLQFFRRTRTTSWSSATRDFDAYAGASASRSCSAKQKQDRPGRTAGARPTSSRWPSRSPTTPAASSRRRA